MTPPTDSLKAEALVAQAKKSALWWDAQRRKPGFDPRTEFQWLLRDLRTAGGLPNEPA